MNSLVARQHSQIKREEILRYLLLGYSQNETVAKAKVGKGTVVSVLEEFRERLGRQEADYIIDLAKNLKKLGIKPSDVLYGARVFSIALKMGLDDEELYSFISRVHASAKKASLDPSDLVAYSAELFALSEQAPETNLKEIPSYYKELSEKAEQLKESISKLQQQKQDAESNTNQSLEESRVTLEQLSEFMACKRDLKKAGLDIDSDVSGFAKMMTEAKKHDFDTNIIQEYCSKESGFEYRIYSLKKQIKTLEGQIQDLKILHESQSKKISSNDSILKRLDKFTTHGISADDLEQLYITVLAISKKHKLSASKALERLYGNLSADYDYKLGLEKTISDLDKTISSKTKELQELSDNLDKLSHNNADLKDTIYVIAGLKRSGIDPAKIHTWNQTLKDCGISLEEYSKLLQDFAGLEKLIASRENKSAGLDEKKTRLSSEIDTLKQQKSRIESAIDQTKKSAVESINDITNHSSQNINTLQDASLERIRNISEQSSDKISEISSHALTKIDANSEDFANLISKVVRASEELGRRAWLYDVVSVIDGKGDPRRVYLSLSNVLDGFLKWQNSNPSGNSMLSKKTKSLNEEIINEFTQR